MRSTAFCRKTLAIFLREHPRIRVSLEEQPSPAIIQAVAAGQVEIGVVAAERSQSGLETQALPARPAGPHRPGRASAGRA
jgi:DNA-binding transcriptional LysR family regulator